MGERFANHRSVDRYLAAVARPTPHPTHDARTATSEANRRVRELAAIGEVIEKNLWTGITQVRPGAGIAVVGTPEQCAETLQNFIDLGCHSFCLSGYLHDEECWRFKKMVRPILAQRNTGRMVA